MRRSRNFRRKLRKLFYRTKKRVKKLNYARPRRNGFML